MQTDPRLSCGAIALALGCFACSAPSAPAGSSDRIAVGVSLLSADERRDRAGQIRDAALASGMTQGYLLAGIADAETSMSHCWSELTWACQGPVSPDCAGGPVVAGAGDGPCELQQGGLGLFQFDAGTHADTLAREGERILYIDGNTQAAVDFVVAMLIRSVYVDGVDDAAQAIAWSNGVRRDNDRWDPWISTVTHYYNGCTPNASCWTQRYAHYLDNTSAVFDEMGAEFWAVAPDFAARYVHQTFPLASEPFELTPGEQAAGYIELRNEGRATWMPGATFLGTTQPRDAHSALASDDWVAPHRAATVNRAVAAGESGRFEFTVRAPLPAGDYPQFFNLVQEGVAWFGDQGGPPDDQLQVRVRVVAPEEQDGGDGARAGAGASAGDGAEAGAGEHAGAGADEDCGEDGGCADDGGRLGGGVSGGDGADAGSDHDGSGGCRAARGSNGTLGVWLLLVLAVLRRVRRAGTSQPRARTGAAMAAYVVAQRPAPLPRTPARDRKS